MCKQVTYMYIYRPTCIPECVEILRLPRLHIDNVKTTMGVIIGVMKIAHIICGKPKNHVGLRD